MIVDLRSQPWWTPADRAELAVFVRELVDDVDEHRQAWPHQAEAQDRPYPALRRGS